MDRRNRGLKLRHVVWLAQDRDARIGPQARVEMRLAITGRDDDRHAGAGFEQLRRQTIAAAVRQTDIDDRKRNILPVRRDLQRRLDAVRFDRAIAELLERVGRKGGDQNFVFDKQDLWVARSWASPAVSRQLD